MNNKFLFFCFLSGLISEMCFSQTTGLSALGKVEADSLWIQFDANLRINPATIFQDYKINNLDIINLLRFGRTKLWSLYETLENSAAVTDVSPEGQASINKFLIKLKKHGELIKTKIIQK